MSEYDDGWSFAEKLSEQGADRYDVAKACGEHASNSFGEDQPKMIEFGTGAMDFLMDRPHRTSL